MKGEFTREIWWSVGIIAGVVVVAAIALFFLANDVAAQASQIVSDKTAAARETETVSMLAYLKSDAVQAAPYTAAMEELLPTHDALIAFPQWIAGIGQAHAVSAAVAFQGSGEPATADAPGSDNFTLTATGALPDLVSSLNDAEVNTPGFLIAFDSFELVNNGTQYALTAQGKVFSR